MKQVGIDTNILLRMVLNDDPDQRAKALAFGAGLSEQNPGCVSLLVLMEFAWALSSRYQQSKQQVVAAIQRLLNVKSITFEDFDAVVRALERTNFAKVDFADALIAEHNLQLGCSHTVTFDQHAAKTIPSMELLT